MPLLAFCWRRRRFVYGFLYYGGPRGLPDAGADSIRILNGRPPPDVLSPAYAVLARLLGQQHNVRPRLACWRAMLGRFARSAFDAARQCNHHRATVARYRTRVH